MGNIGINSNAFSNQTNIISVKFNKNCTFVGESAFAKCTSLSEINKDNVIEEIHSNAFAGCSKLSSVQFNNLKSLGNNVFSECINLTHINMPIYYNIPNGAFYKCSKLSSINVPPYSSFSIGNSAFEECSNLNDIKLYNCISIGSSAFKNCINLSKINLYKCSNIGESAFYGCSNLTRVYIYKDISNTSSAVCKLGSNAFHIIKENDGSFKYPIFYIHPDIISNYQSSSNSTWSDDYKKNMVPMVQNDQIIYTTTNNKIIGNIIGNINDNEYKNKYDNGYGLIQFTKEISTLNSNIFGNLIDGSDSDSNSDSNYLKTVDLPESCKNIEDNAFNGCENLSDITLSDSLETIGNFAFKNCKSLTSFTIPQSVTTLGEGIFSGCENIKKIEGKFTSSDGKSVIYNEKLICVLPNDNRRICNISNIDKNITDLGNSCFYGCKNLRRIDIPLNIKSIGNNAFKGCDKLYEIHFHGNTPPKINEDTFKDINNNINILVPEDRINNYYEMWKDNSTLMKLIEDKQIYIHPMPKNNCLVYYSDEEIIGIRTTTKPNKFININYYITKSYIKNIQSGYFTNKSQLKKVILGENIGINSDAFKNCTNLEYIHLSDSVSELGDESFYNCEKLKKINIPEINCKFGHNIFEGCTNLEEFIAYNKSFVSDDSRCYINGTTIMFFASGGEYNKEYTIPNNITKINKYAFKNSPITKINLSNSTTTIDDYAFSGCSSLESISNWENVKIISKSAFSDCKLLGEISLPQNLQKISEHAFSNCENMTLKDNIPNSVTEIGSYAFNNCNSLESVNINENIKTILSNTFNRCTKLTSVNISDSVTEIKSYAFYNCNSLESVTISNTSNLEVIGTRAFEKCDNLNTLELSNAKKLKNIGNYAFNDCQVYGYKDESYIYEIPDSIENLGRNCFSGTGIQHLKCNSHKLKTIPDYAFNGCTNLKSITLPSNLMYIGDYAFNGCTNLKYINAPLSLTDIEEYTFNDDEISIGDMNIGMNFVILPATINTIGNYAFYGCKLYNITLPTNIYKLGDRCFENVSYVNIPIGLQTPPLFSSLLAKPFGTPGRNTLIINIPNSYLNVYKTNTYWSSYFRNMLASPSIVVEFETKE